MSKHKETAQRAVETHSETLKILKQVIWYGDAPEAYKTTLQYRQRIERDRLNSAQALLEHANAGRPDTPQIDQHAERIDKLRKQTDELNQTLKT